MRLRDAVYARARGRCECGCNARLDVSATRNLFSERSRELDHFFGRSKVGATVETCWVLSRRCHRAKTENKPSRSVWLSRFITHCQLHGYVAAAELAQAKLDWLNTKMGMVA